LRPLDFIRLLRPQFLIAGVALNLLGTAVALHLGASMDWAKFAMFQLVISSSQLAGACANEYADTASDRLNANRTWFSGGSGMIISGRVTSRTVASAILFWAGLALVAALVLAFPMNAGALSFVLVAVGLSLALTYSLRPLMLSYRGLGEIAMAFMVSFLTPVVSSYVISGAFHELVVWASVPLVLQLLGLMMVVEYPDRDADLAAGKNNLVVRLGVGQSWSLGILMLVAGGAVAIGGIAGGLPTLAAIISGAILLAEALIFWVIGRTPESRTKAFWSPAISCGFYVLVIMVLAATIYGS
jgi:1,4-dihydroxy-2-naphthoate octaprenyltransferase